MMAKNVNVPARVIESRPKTMSCARCTVNSTIDSNEEMVSGTFCFIGAPAGACARPARDEDRSYGMGFRYQGARESRRTEPGRASSAPGLAISLWDYGFGAVDVSCAGAGAGAGAGVVVAGVVVGFCGAFAFFLRRETPFSRLTSSTCGTRTDLAGSLASCVPIEYACVAMSARN